MKCVLILLSLVALGYSVPLIHKDIHIVVEENGSINITGHYGNKFVITKVLGYSGPKNVEILVEDKYSSARKVLLDQDIVGSEYWHGLSEADILAGIFRHYQGVLDVNKYDDLLRQVYYSCQSGYVNMAVYNILKCVLVEEYSWSKCVLVHEVSPKWYSLLNRLGLKSTGSGYQQESTYNVDPLSSGELSQKNFERVQYVPNYFREPRYTVGQREYWGRVIPEQYYGYDADTFKEQMVEPYQYQHYHQGLWQQPMYQRVQHMHSIPQGLNYYRNYLNAPVAY